MPYSVLRLLRYLACMVMIFRVAVVAFADEAAAGATSAGSPMSVLVFFPREEQKQQNQIQPQIDEDYVDYDPAPYFGGGGEAPIPH